MKNLRKLFTLALALMVLVSVFTLPAMAATVEHECEAASEIQPRYPIFQCSCGGAARFVKHDTDLVGDFSLYICDTCGKQYKIYN
ncbi:MAG: hypothetical protein Q4D50_13165 [Eubacteriales bacterium]|nr:hypothetical protein [Eubacteriales bacterium]